MSRIYEIASLYSRLTDELFLSMLVAMNWWGIAISYVFVFAVIGIAQVLLRAKIATPSATRKIIHIGVAHWWLLAMLFFDRWEFAIVGPVSFVLINLASYIFRLFPAMEHEQRSKNLGTVYFPIALIVCVILCWAGSIPTWIGGLGVLILGYGDGLAALFGEHINGPAFKIFGNRKSLAGTVAMFAASAIVAILFALLTATPHFSGAGAVVLFVASTAAFATVIELVTPLGIDNLTIPILTTLFVNFVLL